MKETEVHPVQTVEVIQPVEVVKPIEVVKTVHKKVHNEENVDANNEVVPLPLAHSNIGYKAQVGADINVKAEAPQTVIVKEVSNIWKQHGKQHNYYLKNTFQNIFSSLFRPPTVSTRLSQQSWQKPQPMIDNKYSQVCLTICKHKKGTRTADLFMCSALYPFRVHHFLMTGNIHL